MSRKNYQSNNQKVGKLLPGTVGMYYGISIVDDRANQNNKWSSNL